VQEFEAFVRISEVVLNSFYFEELFEVIVKMMMDVFLVTGVVFVFDDGWIVWLEGMVVEYVLC